MSPSPVLPYHTQWLIELGPVPFPQAIPAKPIRNAVGYASSSLASLTSSTHPIAPMRSLALLLVAGAAGAAAFAPLRHFPLRPTAAILTKVRLESPKCD